MASLHGYVIEEELVKENSDTHVYRGRDERLNKVIIKIPKDAPNLPELTERLRYEYEITKSLHGDGTVKAYALEQYKNRLALVLEDYGTYSIKELLEKRTLSLDEFLMFALSITEALEKIHKKNIIHKNINPSNILWDTNTKEAKIIDFAAASILPREIPEIRDTVFIQKSMLYYMSPEQTGRMNRGIDYRTDFYSLGIVFYEMATGILPFKSEDMSELVHFHLAKMPVPPHYIKPHIPKHVSDIIMKLLTKMAEDRYQSLFGVKEDLKLSIAKLRHPDNEPIVIGQKDLLSKFQITEKLYGRDEELEHLLNAFNQASEGHARLILVTGYGGIGKSSLVHELYKPMVEKHGYFIAGKFDQFKRNIPYSSIVQAFEVFIQQILRLSEKEIEIWRERLQSALGNNAQVLVDVIPELASLIGEQPAVPTLGLTETQNRFKLAFQNFIRALATPDHPLAIFLDDLQWADLPSLKLIENLLLHPESKYFLIIGAYRDNEVDSSHILQSSLAVLKQANFFFNTISLKPLEVQHIVQLLKDTLHQDEKAVFSLAKICYEKTQGNPFFLNQFLQTIYNEGLFEFNYNDGHWYWDISAIQHKAITNDVVELIVLKLQELPLNTQKVLQFASCLGNRFSLDKLALINEKTPKSISKDLWVAMDKGLIAPIDTSYKYVTDEANKDVIYQFSHDRVQQAIYSLIEENYRNWLRLKIGRLLLQHTPQTELDNSAIEIVNQYNFGVDLIVDVKERALLAELNLLAGKKAKTSVAYKVALNYFQTGIRFLEKDCWQTQYDLALSLYTEIVEASYLATEFDEMNNASKIVIDNAKSIFDKVKVFETQILYLTNHHEYDKAIHIMLSVLKETGITLPQNPTKLHIILFLIRTKLSLIGKKVNELVNLPEMVEPKWKTALHIIRSTAGASYLSNPNLFVVSGFQAIILLIKHGNTPQAARSYVVYGHILCGALRQIEIGYQFGELSMKLCEKFNAVSIMAQVWMVHAVFIKHWHDHIEDCLQLMFTAFQKGLENGDIEYAGYSIAAYSSMAILAGKKLSPLYDDLSKYHDIVVSIDQRTAINWLSCAQQILQNLFGLADDVRVLKGKAFDEEIMMPEYIAKKDTIGALAATTFKMLLCFLFNDYKQAFETGKKGKEFTSAIGVFILPFYYFFYSLACIGCCADVKDKNRASYLKIVKSNQKLLRLWAKHAPMNYEHKYYLVEAELARLHNDTLKAEFYYDEAIQLAKQNKYLTEEAMANELAAKYYLQQGNERVARSYINDAYNCYVTWGATAKVSQLEKQYPHLLASTMQTAEAQVLAKSLDLATVLKSSQIIVQEIELEGLLEKMMHIVIENVGAEKGYLLLEKNKQWYIEAESSVDRDAMSILMSIPIEGRLPLSIIQYVLKTKAPLVLDDAAHDDQFSSDPYVKANQPKSIFCLPLMSQGVLAGMVYMENNITKHAFTQDRLNLLSILSTQIVIAIDNARQYRYKKMLTSAYERFVPQQYLNYLNKSSIKDVMLGDQVQRDMTILISDIRNFTTISEKMTPQECMVFLNDHLSRLEHAINKNNGFIDKYVGDAVIALFSSADDAITASIEILHTLNEHNRELLLKNQACVNIGIGLSSGTVTLGTVGVQRRMQGTAISEAVSTTEGIEQLTKKYRAPLIITEDTYIRLRNPALYAIRKLDTVSIPGQQNPINIYEVFNNEPEDQVGLKNQTIKEFEKGIKLYQQKKYDDALEIFQHILKINNLDAPASFFVEQCQSNIGSP